MQEHGHREHCENDADTTEDERRVRAIQRARGVRTARRVTLERVDLALRRLVDGTYVRGQTDRELAELWALSPARVRNIVAEASRVLLRYSRENPSFGEEYLARALCNWERIRAKSEALGTERGFAVALQADDLILTYLGMRPPRKVDIVAENRFDAWTDEELKEYVATGKRPANKSF
jgi:hypothetical protein